MKIKGLSIYQMGFIYLFFLKEQDIFKGFGMFIGTGVEQNAMLLKAVASSQYWIHSFKMSYNHIN